VIPGAPVPFLPANYLESHKAAAQRERIAPLNAFHAAEAQAMSEADLQGLICDLCSRLRVIVHHEEISDWSEAGWPDLTLIGCSGFLIPELKRENGVVKPAQQDTLTALHIAGVNVRLWRPSDWVSGTIEREIRAIAHNPSPGWISLYSQIREREAKKRHEAAAKAQQTRARNRTTPRSRRAA
jgi:hypothetical protein